VRFSANISTLFTEAPFLDRFALAARAGFSAVEFWWPTDDLEAVRAAVRDAGVHVALLNFDGGDLPAGDRGLLSNPATHERFRENVPVALALARDLGCDRLNLLVGQQVETLSRAEQLGLACRNVQWAADEAASSGITVLIEAVNTKDLAGYLLDTTAAATAFLQQVARPNVAYQYDVYHMQRMEGDLVSTLRAEMPHIGHIQIADSPGRGEPGTGEIRFPYVLSEIEALGYTGYVGLEYIPTSGTEESLRWLPRELRGHDIQIDQLAL